MTTRRAQQLELEEMARSINVASFVKGTSMAERALLQLKQKVWNEYGNAAIFKIKDAYLGKFEVGGEPYQLAFRNNKWRVLDY